MNRKMNGLVKTAASISLVGGMLTLAAGPAFAAAPNEAYAASATGLIQINPPLGLASSDGTSPVQLANINVAGLITSGIVTDTADGTSASSTIANLAVTLSGIASLAATAVTSSCSFDTDTNTVSGTASLAGASFSVLGIPTSLAVNPPPNTTVTVPGVATLTLNRQSTAGDGTLTVDAIYVNLLSGGQTLTIGESVCNDATLAPVSILPGMATPIGLGTLGLLALGGAAYYFGRRRRVTVAA
jgi:hypothetical protein